MRIESHLLTLVPMLSLKPFAPCYQYVVVDTVAAPSPSPGEERGGLLEVTRKKEEEIRRREAELEKRCAGDRCIGL